MNDKQKDNVCTKIKNIIALISQSDFSSLCLIAVSILLSLGMYLKNNTGSNLSFSDILRISMPKMRMWDKFYDKDFCKLCTFLY